MNVCSVKDTKNGTWTMISTHAIVEVSIEGVGHKLYTDSFFSSSNLAYMDFQLLWNFQNCKGMLAALTVSY
jgi:hypothetical protein